MTSVICPRCGVANEPPGAFCSACGAPMNGQPGGQPPAGWPPPAPVPPPPPAGYAPVPPAAGYPPGYVPKILGNNTKWAIGLGIAAFFCCGPLTSIPGIFLAKKDMDEIAAGRAPQLNDGWARGAFYLNLVALVLAVVGFCVWFGLLRGVHR
jgi:hypothetical protein